jgi:hypothetical protein
VPGLDRLDEGQRLPDARQVVARIPDVGVGAHSDREHDRVGVLDDRGKRLGRVDRDAELERDTELCEHARLRRQRLCLQAVGRDRIAGETAGLAPLVVHGDCVPECRELPRARQARRSGADHRDAKPVVRGPLPELGARPERMVGREPLEQADLDRLLALVPQHAGSLAEDLDGADAAARAAEQVLREDDSRRLVRVVRCERGDEPGNVDARRACDDARRGCVRPTALEAAVGLDERSVVVERGLQLVEDRLPVFHDRGHASTLVAAGRDHIGGHAEARCGKRATSTGSVFPPIRAAVPAASLQPERMRPCATTT